MPVVTFVYDDLIDLLGQEVSVEKLMDRIPQIGADVHHYDPDTGEIAIEFFPDRPDLYCVEGAARALRAFLGFEKGLTVYPLKESGITLRREESVVAVRPYVVAGVVRDVVMTDRLIRSLMELQEKLHLTLGRKRVKVAIGVHDLDKVTPPFVYKAVDPRSVSFVPLAKEKSMDLQEILETHEKGVGYRHLLDGKSLYPLIVDANNEVLSFPPIINGRLTTVTEKTRNVFVDVTGTDLHAISGALNIVTTAMAERGGRIETVTVIADGTMTTPDLVPRPWRIEVKACNALLGTKLDAEGMARNLEKMGYDAQARGTTVDVLAPGTRLDLIHPVDIIEDVAKGYGYEHFGKGLPTVQTFGDIRVQERAADVLKQMMIGHGFLEVTTLVLTSPQDQFSNMKLAEEEVVEVLNPVSEDHTCLRVRLLPSIMAVLRKNKHRDLPQKMFEVGDVLIGIKRRKHLAGAVISSKASFTETKSLVESILHDLSTKYAIIPSASGMFIEGRGASIIVDGRTIGEFGELHPGVITNFELGHPVTVFEIDAEAVTEGKLEHLA
jgi:phenylalanyl-tRNA synthetase beta chain